jgi:hypothetical protein
MTDRGKPQGYPWSADDEARLTELWNDQHSDDFIAEDLGRSARAIAVKRQKMGLVRQKLGRPSELQSLADDTLIRELNRRGYLVRNRRDRSIPYERVQAASFANQPVARRE